MANVALKAEKRNDKEIRKNAASKLGREGFIPAVMYGLEKKPESIKIKRKELIKLIKGHNISSIIFDIHLDDKTTVPSKWAKVVAGAGSVRSSAGT